MKPKRSRGGYVMIYVMVVIVIISAMSLSVSSISLRNLQAQEASIRQMKDTYGAEGMVEMFCEWLKLYPFDTADAFRNKDTLNNAWKESAIGSIGKIEVTSATHDDDDDKYDISITAKAYAEEHAPPEEGTIGTMQVVAELEITVDSHPEESGAVCAKDIKYTSYTVSPAEKTEGGGSGGGSE